MNRDEVLQIYDEAVNKCDRFRRKGKTMPYTSANGHMFSLLNKDGQLGIRFSKELQNRFIEEYKTTTFKSYGATMRGYILIPDELLNDQCKLIDLLNGSYDYVMTLEAK
jgi:hypothetical protein